VSALSLHVLCAEILQAATFESHTYTCLFRSGVQWCEFYDDTTPSPFSDFWHTKEGVSIGNEGGPWDSLSIPMQGCMRGVKPRSVVNTLWAASWSSSTYLPLQWSDSITAEDWSFVGGINRCGAYCTAFGCGVNQSSHWDAHECQPTPA
jgi:hypothetical protein